MTDRLKEILSNIPECEILADIGCDHGYLSLYALESGKVKKVIASDVSSNCLEKATKLLYKFIESGQARTVLSNGFDKVPDCACALIAGMGGEEIISILNKRENLPRFLVLQPMKNIDKVRRVIISSKYHINRDYTFFADGKFYNLIVAEQGLDFYTEEEYRFGRENLMKRPLAFVRQIEENIRTLEKILDNDNIGEKDRERLNSELKELKKYVKVR